ncbi:GNAT family N-acetyltransferase [Aliiglaciecola sp. 2_MG-2023]|uniref:GNAT family N-acetyltransferase n=1 Tax=unclassified Aliiglaciecola TaxID=2593648 RepID=UPI0026E3268E|nr:MULTISPECIES: GNAT family N-acetyltransferase [unclassified Aliiglaciecola]MDO6710977.1 GNAT family N-acetyltransferase [Aliiglaciecola sp. 2_MG-2023]MDO6752458.1 GNAT family N-acetyltransferase [Aliiglaciecola sp. 1_MG-2023]
MNYCFYAFEQLSPNQLYQILRLRQNVFVLEQKSFYDDIDNLDQLSKHLCVYSQKQQLLAYSRLRIVGEASVIGKIERVVVDSHARGQRIAAQMMDEIIEYFQQDTKVEGLLLSAQVDVIAFYKKWGFEIKSELYDDGGIDHVDMFLSFK